MGVSTGPPGSFFYVLEDPVHILFVDDDPIMREFAQVHLTTETAQVTVAADGVEACAAIEADAFDVILLDLEMPNMDGFEVLARLRADERTRRLPVVVVTGREDVAAIDRAFQAGATSFLVKPINWRLLSYQIRYIRRTAESELALVQDRARAGQEARRATAALMTLAAQAAPMLREAMSGPPGLRKIAGDYVALLEDAAGAVRVDDERPSFIDEDGAAA